MEKITQKTEVSATELATILGLTGRRIYQLRQDGILNTPTRGRYNLAESVQAYVEYRSQIKEVSSTDEEKAQADLSIKKAKAIITVLEAKELEGKMHRSEDVADMTEDLIYTIRGMLLALPGRLAVDVATVSTPLEAAEIIRKEIYAVMTEISRYEYDPKKYEDRVRERRNWEEKNRSSDDLDDTDDEG